MILTTLQTTLKALNTTEQKSLSQSMGYANFDKFTKRLEVLFASHSLQEFLDSNGYDLVYDSKSFIRALVRRLNLSSDALQSELKAYERLKEEIEAIEQGYIFVNTHFKRNNEPIFALALLERRRRLPLDGKSLAFEPLAMQLKTISQTLQTHYINHQGTIGIWGTIQSYTLYLKGYEYIFDKEGLLQPCQTTPTQQSRATLMR